MAAQYIIVKQAKLNNNCPECYSREGLELIFRQGIKETELYRLVTSKTTKLLRCLVCNTDIFPVRWTDEIEQVVEYHNKAFVPKPALLRLKKLSWIIIVATILFVVFTLLFVLNKL